MNPYTPNYNIVKFGQNMKKNPRHLRRLTATHALVKAPQLKFVYKTRKKYNKRRNLLLDLVPRTFSGKNRKDSVREQEE